MNHLLFFRSILADLYIPESDVPALLNEVRCPYIPITHAGAEGDNVDGEIEVLVTNDFALSIADLDRFPNLKMVSLAYTGYNKQVLQHAESRGIRVYYVPGYATDSVAELNLALTLALLRKIPLSDSSIRQGAWHDMVKPGTELAGKTVGIVGTGTIGMRSAEIYRAFGCRVIGWSRTQQERFTSLGGTYVAKDDLFGAADIVVLCLALNPDTEHFVGEREIGQMADRGSILINTARSGLVHKPSLLQALRDRKITAGLDVYDQQTESRGMDELFELENVVLTPHVGFKTREALRRLGVEAIRNVGRFAKGEEQNRLA